MKCCILTKKTSLEKHSEKNFENKTYYVLKMTTRKKDGYKKP